MPLSCFHHIYDDDFTETQFNPRGGKARCRLTCLQHGPATNSFRESNSIPYRNEDGVPSLVSLARLVWPNGIISNGLFWMRSPFSHTLPPPPGPLVCHTHPSLENRVPLSIGKGKKTIIGSPDTPIPTQKEVNLVAKTPSRAWQQGNEEKECGKRKGEEDAVGSQ